MFNAILVVGGNEKSRRVVRRKDNNADIKKIKD